jgi:hypothetical protein
MDTDTSLERIRSLNDDARRHFTDGRIVFTSGIAALPVDDQAEILDRVRTFDAFSPDNDPYGEHDFGAFEYNGQRIFWKIDSYDRDERFGSPDPADPYMTRRVLTIMLAGEY